jgi:hypothetical protein
VYRLQSSLNHSCVPNVSVEAVCLSRPSRPRVPHEHPDEPRELDEQDPEQGVVASEPRAFRILVRALKPVAAQAQLFHDYVDPALSGPARADRLRIGYHFVCTCARCSDPSGEGERRSRGARD